ncbi:hypothetical protein MACK_001771 [Theileria orientalis]|uniref:Uncharacterized protein n=1 Tax=Theileria orientalis TaxID=68886 RepID=A0A976QUU6_THEOR|nr:hypothetical protein MACK_001771 [Theileria orientalis]
MKASVVAAISAIVFIILAISLYFGLRKVGRVDVTYVPSSSKPILDFPTYKDPNVLILNLDKDSFLNKDKLSSTSSDVPGLQGYKKILFSLPQRKHIDEAKVKNSKLVIVPGIFSRATIYTWFSEPLLVIINTLQVVDDKEVNRFHYFAQTDNLFDPFSEYKIDSDIQDNPVEMEKLLKKINRDRKCLFSFDIGNGLGDPTTTSHSLEDDTLRVTKSLSLFPPFIEAEIYTGVGMIQEHFQIDQLTHNGNALKINLPSFKLNRIIIYFWDRNPIMLVFISDKKYFYYDNKSSDEWTRLTNGNGNVINGKLTDEELHKRMQFIILKRFNAFYLDTDNTDSYEFAGEKISVIPEKPTSDDVNTEYKYKHYVDKGVFKLGACFENKVLLELIPIGLNLESMTVHYNGSIAILIRLSVVENGKKRDIYFSRNQIFHWINGKKPEKTSDGTKPQASTSDGTKQDTEGSTPLFDESKNVMITLDIGKKRDYKCMNESRYPQFVEISVKPFDRYGYYTIYTQEPIHSDSSDKNKLSFGYSGMTSYDIKLLGILPGKISKMNVYFLDDLVPVGIEVFSNEQINYVNMGNNFWKIYTGSYGKFLLDPSLFEPYSRSKNFVVAFDVGNKVIHLDRGEPPSVSRGNLGVYKEYALQLYDMSKFIFHGLTFRGIWYKFDSLSLFSHKFVQIKIYYDNNDKIPLMFELSGQESFRFYNQFDGTWKNIFHIFDDITPSLALTYINVVGSISIDNYRDYNNGSMDITVTTKKISDKYVKFVHTPTKNTKFDQVLYRAYYIKASFKIPDFTSVTAYFKTGTHLALMIEFHINSVTYACRYNKSDSWTTLQPFSDVLQTLDEIHSKFYPSGS